MRRAGIAVLALTAALAALAAAGDAPAPFAKPPAIGVVAFSPDGKTLVAGFGGKGEPSGAACWEVATRKRLWRIPGAAVTSVSFAPDGTALAVARGTASATRLDPRTGKALGEIGPHPSAVRSVAHVPRTNLLATASDGTIRLWDVKTGKVARQLAGGHPKEVRSVVVSPNGKWLVSTGPDTTRIWDVAAGKELKGVLNQRRGIAYYGIVFVGPDRLMMANNSAAQAVRELPSGKVLLRFRSAGGYDRSAYSEAAGLAAFSGYGRPEAALADLTFRPPSAAERKRIEKLLKDFDDDSYEVREAASTAMRAVGSVAEPALRAASSAGPSAEVRMRAREARRVILDEPVRRLSGHTGAVGALAFAPDGKVFATGAEDGTVRLWDPRTGKELARLEVAEAARGASVDRLQRLDQGPPSRPSSQRAKTVSTVSPGAGQLPSSQLTASSAPPGPSASLCARVSRTVTSSGASSSDNNG
jgi:WD40 repeat protein